MVNGRALHNGAGLFYLPIIWYEVEAVALDVNYTRLYYTKNSLIKKTNYEINTQCRTGLRRSR